MAATADTLTLCNFIDGEFTSWSGPFMDVEDPSIGEVYARLPDSDEAEVNKAVQAATQAFPGWSETPAKKRAEYINKMADIIEVRMREFSEAESRDQGKTITFASNVDIPRAVLNLRHFAASAGKHMEKCQYDEGPGALNYTSRSPVGVAGLISPWNLPLYLLTFKLAPCLASGNTAVCKPSEMTSVTAWMMCQAAKEAGLPCGVLNLVLGSGACAGDALVKHPDVRLVSFTGSTATATVIRRAAAQYTKKLSLELGGKNAAIVFADADLEKCLPISVSSSFANQGEICLCTSRIFVQRQIYNKFVEKFVQAARNMKVGDPRSTESQMGALISKEHKDKVVRYISYAIEDGGKVLCGYGVDPLELPERNRQGYFVAPTVISDLSDDSRCMQEEIFGPVTCIVPFDTQEEVISRVNNIQYGLCASLWSSNVNTCHQVAAKLQVGTVWVNCWLVRNLDFPFGGVKNSGIGREGTEDSMEFFTDVKTICVKM